MATSSKVQLSTSDAGVFHAPNIQKSSAAKGSDVLQENHDSFHCFFNQAGFHNHIVHHLLTIYALGATPEEIQKGYDSNKSYQRPPGKLEERIIQDLSDRKQFLKHMDNEKFYIDFLKFFQSEIDKKGVAQTFQEHIFAGDETANAMFANLYSGFLHPIIHTGFGVEFNQPAIIAEGLAETAVSNKWLTPFFDDIESRKPGGPSGKTLFDLIPEIQANEKLAHSANWEDPNKVRDGVLARAPKEMVDIATQWRVNETDDLEKKTAEMANFCTYFTGTALNPRKQIKFDFYFMHCLNASIFFTALFKQDWIADVHKRRLLEHKAWLDLAMYVSRNSPSLHPEEITSYKEKIPGDWESVIRRVNGLDDDGHASKFIRALANGERICKPYEEKENWPIQGDMWLKLAHMVIDSVEAEGAKWARSVGFPQAWEEYADRK